MEPGTICLLTVTRVCSFPQSECCRDTCLRVAQASTICARWDSAQPLAHSVECCCSRGSVLWKFLFNHWHETGSVFFKIVEKRYVGQGRSVCDGHEKVLRSPQSKCCRDTCRRETQASRSAPDGTVRNLSPTLWSVVAVEDLCFGSFSSTIGTRPALVFFKIVEKRYVCQGRSVC